jgi:hypothetical protein
LMIMQSGDNITVKFLPPGRPEIVIYEGTFESDTVIAGRELDTSAPQENRWLPMRSVVRNLNQVQLDPKIILKRGTPNEAVPYEIMRRMASEKLPTGPFDLVGTWAFETGQPVFVTKDGAEVGLKTEREGQFFRGRYTSNPVISGEGLRRDASGSGLTSGAMQVTVLDPDHLMFLGHLVSRTSNPPSHDVACDDHNASHVKGDYARARGAAAYSEKDYKAARCWLAIGADWGYASAQSMLAALIIDGKDGTAPDYALAFDLASKSAENGDMAGQFELASMYQNGKGTPQDAEKAKLWLQRAQHAEGFAKMQAAMTPDTLAKNLGMVMGMAGSMVDFNLNMAPTCFAQEALGSRPTSECGQSSFGTAH